MTPEFVALVLGLSVCFVALAGIWAWRMERIETRITEQQVANLHSAVSALGESNTKRSDEIAAVSARVVKLEKAMKMEDGAPKVKAIPEFMR